MSKANPYAAPQSRVSDVGDDVAVDIDALDVSPTWKTRFRLIQEAGGPAMPGARSLSFGDRTRVMFNILAFLFGPLYYLAKGLWRKAIVFFVGGVILLTALSLLLEFVGLSGADRALGTSFAVLFAIRANIDYYKRIVLNDNGWW